MENLVVLIIGLGSMGKRRIRCLKALGINSIWGYDTREDRKREAKEKYQIQIIDDPFDAQQVLSLIHI